MGVRSTVEVLPEALRLELDKRLVERSFGGYRELVDWLNAQGVEISCSALHRYGQRFEQKLKAVRASTQLAQSLTAALPDDEGTMNEAILRMTQNGLFEMLVNAEEDLDADQLSKLARAASELSRASVNQKRYRAEVKAQADKVAGEIAREVKQAGLSDSTAEAIRARILGIGA